LLVEPLLHSAFSQLLPQAVLLLFELLGAQLYRLLLGKADHLGHVFVVKPQQVQQPVVPEAVLVFYLDVVIEQLLADVVHEHPETTLDEALQQVDNLFLLGLDRHVLGALTLVFGGTQDALQLGIADGLFPIWPLCFQVQQADLVRGLRTASQLEGYLLRRRLRQFLPAKEPPFRLVDELLVHLKFHHVLLQDCLQELQHQALTGPVDLHVVLEPGQQGHQQFQTDSGEDDVLSGNLGHDVHEDHCNLGGQFRVDRDREEQFKVSGVQGEGV
jgi:hypothetical protein